MNGYRQEFSNSFFFNRKNALFVENLNAKYENINILENISFYVPNGSLCAIVGPNGAGKSTLLKSILGLHKSRNEDILFWNDTYLKFKDYIAYVPQKKSVDWNFPINVFDIVSSGVYDITRKFSFFMSYDDEILVENAMKIVGIEKLYDCHINELSGGQQQKVFIARAFAQNAYLYLMDEPFAGLDEMSMKKIFDVFKTFKKENRTLIAVHHDLKTLKDYFDWIILIKKNIIYFGPIDIEGISEKIESVFK
jgi:manganese/zinc/iron transport system ATP- binding protein